MEDLGYVAILCIHENSISYINKIYDFRRHIEYFIELAKKDDRVKEVLSGYDTNYLLEHPSEIYFTIIKKLISLGTCLIMTFDPKNILPCYEFFACMPESINQYQKNTLENLKAKCDGEFTCFDVYDNSINDFQNIMKAEDKNKDNFYLIDTYINNAYNSLNKSN